MRWVSREGKPSLEKMTPENTCLTHVHGIVAGETPKVCDLSFRDPDCFQFGQLRTRIRLWENILNGYEPAKDVLDWVGAWGGCQKFIKPFKGSFMGVKCKSAEPQSRVFKKHYCCNSSCKQFCKVSSRKRSVFRHKWLK